VNRAIWVLQILLAIAFTGAGSGKVLTPKEGLVQNGMAWAEGFSDTTIKLIGVAEVAGAIGLIVPAATGIMPVLTPIAAGALTLVMGGAVVTHVGRGESFGPPLVLGLLSALVALMRNRDTRAALSR
jgi:hypothetical protein